MKTTILKSVLVAFVVTTGFISCSSDPVSSNDNANVSKPPPPALAQFYYKEGGALGYSTVSNPFVKSTTKKIFAVDGTNSVIEIQMASLAVGTYPIGSLTKFTYKKPFTTKTWYAGTGTVTISFNASGLLSGTYNMTSGTGIPSVNSVSGYFETLPITP
jgi:hypothetical protein